MRKLLSIMSLCCLLPVAGAAYPTPALAPLSWELTFRFQDPRRISVVVPGQRDPVVYWYMLYSVENLTDREVDFYPQFVLVTGTLQVYQSEVKVSPEAYRVIERLAGDPLLVPPEKVIGRLRRGEDQARRSVAIWRDFDPTARAFTVYVSGLSGEMVRLKNPAFNADQPESDRNREYFLLRKTLAIPYQLPGSEKTRGSASPKRLAREQKWVMR